VVCSHVAGGCSTGTRASCHDLSAYAGRGAYLHQEALRTIRAILDNAHVTIWPQTHESFMKGLDFYASRADKAYSLVDCISMDTMRQMGLTRELSYNGGGVLH
jgi:hypothetical protein